MKTHFAYETLLLEANIPNQKEIAGQFVTVRSVTGTVIMKFDDHGAEFQVFGGLTYRLSPGERFEKVTFSSVAGGAVSYYFGTGYITASSTSGGTNPAIVGDVDDPNGAGIVPEDPLAAGTYYKDQAVPVIEWLWSPTNQNWFVAIS